MNDFPVNVICTDDSVTTVENFNTLAAALEHAAALILLVTGKQLLTIQPFTKYGIPKQSGENIVVSIEAAL